MDKGITKKVTGSKLGFITVIGIGFAFYYLLSNIGGNSLLVYDSVVDGITSNFLKQIQWLFMNFTEPQFYAGIFSGAAVILGGFAAWLLAQKNSKITGMDICYGNSNLFPWILASQLISVGLAIFVFRYINLFDSLEVTWVATFVSLVGAPPSVMLLYGPSITALLTGSILGGLLCPPVATWFSIYVVTPLGIPGVVSNVVTMAVTGIIICFVCRALPWIKKCSVKNHRRTTKYNEDVYSAGWFVRRCLADFSEAQFYGNEVTSIFLLVGVTLDWFISKNLPAYGSGLLPEIILSQFAASAVGVLLYAGKFDNGGWYATYVPVVSVGPACVLFFGGGIPAALFAGALGGIIGGPAAELFAARLPEGIHSTNANVLAMAICTIIVSMVMKFLGCF